MEGNDLQPLPKIINLVVLIVWIIKHPIQTYKILVCTHDSIDINTLKCSFCGKQYRSIPARDYVKSIKGIK